MSVDAKIAAALRREDVLIDGPHHSQRRTIRKIREAVPWQLSERHEDAVTRQPVVTYDATVNTAGTVTWLCPPPAPPMSSGGAIVASR